MELQLYQTVLYLAGAVNIMIAFVLLHNNYMYRNYDVYLRSRRFMALNYVIFGIGFTSFTPSTLFPPYSFRSLR